MRRKTRPPCSDWKGRFLISWGRYPTASICGHLVGIGIAIALVRVVALPGLALQNIVLYILSSCAD